EETFHARALARFLEAAGHDVVPRVRSKESLPQRIEALATAWLARAWPDFVAVHMTWGAINELTTLTGYRRLAELAGHPVLSDLLARIMRDESRHFAFYFHQAARRLVRPRTARLTRRIVERFWAPVGAGVQPDEELRFLAGHLLSGPDARAAARRTDEAIRSLPGLAGVELMDAWLARTRPDASGGSQAARAEADVDDLAAAFPPLRPPPRVEDVEHSVQGGAGLVHEAVEQGGAIDAGELGEEQRQETVPGVLEDDASMVLHDLGQLGQIHL